MKKLLAFSLSVLVVTSGWSQTGNPTEEWVKSFDENGSRGKHALEKFVTNVKLLNVGKDTVDEVVNALGATTGKKNKSIYGENISYQFKTDANTVTAQVSFDQLGILKAISVTKYTPYGPEEIYNKSANISPVNNISEMIVPSNQPKNPKNGQIYFNVNDAHFYGWNGSIWKQLDK